MEEKTFIKTADGSITLCDESTGEWYHNSAGAYRESMDNYVTPAVYLLNKSGSIKSIKLLDVCFGLGYNSFSFLNHLLESEIPVDTVEIYAVELDKSLSSVMAETIAQKNFQVLNGCQFVDSKSKLELKDLFIDQSIASSNLIQSLMTPEKPSSVQQLSFNLYFEDLRSFIPGLVEGHKDSFDLVFHDPFSANKQPQFWTCDLFSVYRKILKEKKGMFFTYSVASAVRGGLIESGFSIYRTKAVGVKSGGTLGMANFSYDGGNSYCDYIPDDFNELPLKSGAVDEQLFFCLDDMEKEKVNSRSGVPYRDRQFNLDRKAILQARQKEQNLF